MSNNKSHLMLLSKTKLKRKEVAQDLGDIVIHHIHVPVVEGMIAVNGVQAEVVPEVVHVVIHVVIPEVILEVGHLVVLLIAVPGADHIVVTVVLVDHLIHLLALDAHLVPEPVQTMAQTLSDVSLLHIIVQVREGILIIRKAEAAPTIPKVNHVAQPVDLTTPEVNPIIPKVLLHLKKSQNLKPLRALKRLRLVTSAFVSLYHF